MLSQIRRFAILSHGDQKYSDKPYVYHLDAVVSVLRRFGHQDYSTIAAGYLHDVIEDTMITRHIIDSMFGSRIAELVFALTNEFGPRNESLAKTYPKIRACVGATPIKLADRISHLEFCTKDSKFFKMYKSEHPGFVNGLYIPGQYEDMWKHLNNLIGD